MQPNADNGRLYIPAVADTVPIEDDASTFYAVLGFIVRRSETPHDGPADGEYIAWLACSTN